MRHNGLSKSASETMILMEELKIPTDLEKHAHCSNSPASALLINA